MKWIRVENEEFPYGDFLVYMPNEKRKVQNAYRVGEKGQLLVIGNCFDFDISKPSHWMPLPAPPKE